jgi:hypothetical protein
MGSNVTLRRELLARLIQAKNPDAPTGCPDIARGRYCSWRIAVTSSRRLLTPVLSKIDLR